MAYAVRKMKAYVCSLAAVLFLLTFLVPATVWTAEPLPVEYRVKSAFIYNFPKFITWPDAASLEELPHLALGYVVENSFVSSYSELGLDKKPLQSGQYIQLLSCVDFSSACAPQILFVNTQDKELARQILSATKDKPILTVGEQNDFAEMGGIINFYTVNKKVRLEINVEAAKQAGFSISSKLLRLARIISSEGQ